MGGDAVHRRSNSSIERTNNRLPDRLRQDRGAVRIPIGGVDPREQKGCMRVMTVVFALFSYIFSIYSYFHLYRNGGNTPYITSSSITNRTYSNIDYCTDLDHRVGLFVLQELETVGLRVGTLLVKDNPLYIVYTTFLTNL